MKIDQLQNHLWYMDMALQEAEKAYKADEVPVGALILSEHGEILAQAHNEKENQFDPTGHAEIIALRKASQKLKSWRLLNATVYVTLEPCPMCLAAMVQARIARLVFGAYDPKGGALSLGQNLYKDTRLNHQFPVVGGVKHYQCSKILSDFFKLKRQFYKK